MYTNVRMFFTENTATVSSYLTNQEPCQSIVLQLNVVLVVERDTIYTAFPMVRIYARIG